MDACQRQDLIFIKQPSFTQADKLGSNSPAHIASVTNT